MGRWIRRACLALYAAVVAAPLYFLLVSTLKEPSAFFTKPLSWPKPMTLANIRGLFESQPMWAYFLNSVTVTLGTVLLTLLLGSLIAYASVRWGGRAGKWIAGLFTLGLIVPSQVNMLPLYSLVRSLGWSDRLWGLVLVSAALLLPITVFMLSSFMQGLHRELLEAGSIDGCGEWRLYASIAMPLSKPAVASVTAFLFVMSWNDLLMPMLLLGSRDNLTLPLALMQFRGEYVTNYTMLLAGVALASLPMVVLFVFLQRFFVAGMTAGAVKG
ncbi:carbohydrate ABC transporter permease [Paenibacillus sp. FSL W8-1187]|uniref:carbohydrate ABC transporter permease n=1 Tax=Paenibacillus sp. FSL W8-1187 TaxID=2975339 RepID=UPI0030DD94DA